MGFPPTEFSGGAKLQSWEVPRHQGKALTGMKNRGVNSPTRIVFEQILIRVLNFITDIATIATTGDAATIAVTGAARFGDRSHPGDAKLQGAGRIVALISAAVQQLSRK